eukprot:7464880-Heterocapsa_arctica.AAC.2
MPASALRRVRPESPRSAAQHKTARGGVDPDCRLVVLRRRLAELCLKFSRRVALNQIISEY